MHGTLGVKLKMQKIKKIKKKRSYEAILFVKLQALKWQRYYNEIYQACFSDNFSKFFPPFKKCAKLSEKLTFLTS